MHSLLCCITTACNNAQTQADAPGTPAARLKRAADRAPCVPVVCQDFRFLALLPRCRILLPNVECVIQLRIA